MLIREPLIYLQQHNPSDCLSCTGPNLGLNKNIYTFYTDIIMVMLFTSLYLIGFMIVLFGFSFEMPSLSFVCTRFSVGFWVSYLYYYWCSVGCGPGDYHFYLTEVTVLWVHLYSHWMPLVALTTFHQV